MSQKGLNKLTIGLFGTCGQSTWRASFIERYTKKGVAFFNPQVDDWDPSLAEIEAWHLANDKVVLFPITSETYATGSLSEVGFSVLQVIRLDDRRDFVILIDQFLDDSLSNEEARKESLRARALVKQHLIKQNLPNVYVVNSLKDMLDLSLKLYEASGIREKHAAKFSVQNLS
jgi:hypothetical protein